MSGKRTVSWNYHAAQGKIFQEDVAVEISQAGEPLAGPIHPFSPRRILCSTAPAVSPCKAHLSLFPTRTCQSQDSVSTSERKATSMWWGWGRERRVEEELSRPLSVQGLFILI